MQLARAWAWRNVLRAAYPDKRIPFLRARRRLPGRGGDQRDHPRPRGRRRPRSSWSSARSRDSSYPAVTSSFLVQTVFDTSVGILVLLYAITQGLLPPLPQIPDLPAFEISFWAENPKLFFIAVGVTVLAIAIGIYSSPTACAASGRGSARAW